MSATDPVEMEGRMKLLLVEDNPINVELFVDSLESDGHEIFVERDGVSGRARAVAEHFDLVVLDVQLPQLDGLTLCRHLRAAGITVPILALSSAAMGEQVRRGKEAGFDAYLTKPIAPAVLRETVRRFETREA